LAKIKKGISTFLKLFVTLLVVVWLVRKLGWNQIVSIVSKADPVWLIVALVVFILSIFLGVIQWRILLKNRGIPLPFGRAVRLYFVGMFFNNFVFGGIVGDALKVVSIRSQDGKGMAGLAATFLDRFAGLWAMCGFAVAGSMVLLNRGIALNGKTETAVLALFVTFILFAGLMVLLISKPVQNLLFKIIDAVPILRKARIREVISEMLIEAHDLHILGSVASLSALIQFLRIGVHALTAASLGLLSVSNYQYFFIFVPVIAMLMTIPLPFGVRETAGGALFAFAGFPTEAAFVMGFLASIVGLVASAVGGIFFIAEKNFISGKNNEKNLYSSTTVQ
jgi:uncharacterized protein (TIRG00374 family)